MVVHELLDKMKRVIVPLLICLYIFWIIECDSLSVYRAPADCEKEILEDGMKLICRTRTIGAFDHSNLTLIPWEGTISLTLLCDDILLSSNLEPRILSHLKQLKELNIISCKISSFVNGVFHGLSSLVNLTINTGITNWSDTSFTLDSSVFKPLQRIQKLDLSNNSIITLIDSLFCNLSSLKYLNLSANSFSDVSSIGFSLKRRTEDFNRNNICSMDSIVELDLSYNRIKVLSDSGFGLLSKLSKLSLRNNEVTRAEENSLGSLNNLSFLDLSNNQLVALPKSFFQPVSSKLSEIYLNNNSMIVLPPGIFNNLASLTILDLSYNRITSHWVEDTFKDLVNLIKLDLSFNKLARIDEKTFRSQSKLQVLQLHHNEIESIGEGVFQSLVSLNTLVLSYNRLIRLESPLSLAGLMSLETLSLDNNRIKFIGHNTFNNITNLKELNISSNLLEPSIPVFIKRLQSLQSLDLSYNRIWNITNAPYQGNSQLYSLNLRGNRIGNLNKGVFSDLPSLNILDLSSNLIESIEQSTFEDVPDLHALLLNSNLITDINGVFVNLTHLIMLNISANKIHFFDYAMIPLGLQWLDIHSNLITKLENHYQVESTNKLSTLDASLNRITEIDSSSLPNGIETVLLQNNLIRKVAPLTFLDKTNLKRVDLSNNSLITLEMNALRLRIMKGRRPLPEFSIAKNPFLCDCTMEWLSRMKVGDDSREYPKIVDLNNIMCSLAFDKHRSQVNLIKAESGSFLCSYKIHCFAVCHCCDFDACDCEMTCPENCNCFYDESWTHNIVDCSIQRHNIIPSRIPMDVTELYLDGNNIELLTSNAFIGRKYMKVLYLNNSNLMRINDKTFNGLKSLQVLNLNDNRLVRLYGYEFEMIDLRELYLSRNEITVIDKNTFRSLRSLRILTLDGNRIFEFDLWSLKVNSALLNLRLSGNMWPCECSFVRPVLNWLHSIRSVLKDDLTCGYNESVKVPLVIGFNMSICTNTSIRSSAQQRFQVQYFVPLVVICAVIMGMSCLIIVILMYRREMSVWLHSKYGVRLDGRVARKEEEKLFDGFVSYSKKDETWVLHFLAAELEYGSPPFHLCLHYRDLPVARGYLSDAIMEAMEASQRIILVISDNFLKGEWKGWEFRRAHCEIGRKDKLIVIVMGKLDEKDLDENIRFWLKSGTVLHLGERLFWDKLRYAMPDTSRAEGVHM